MSNSKHGAFIVIEGLDRSGKSTQASLLHERLQDSQDAGATTPPKVVLLKFPGAYSIHVPHGTQYKSTPRSHDNHREDDRRVPPFRVRAGRPRHPPTLL